MADLDRKVAALAPHLRVAWDDARATAALRGVRRRQRARAVTRVVAGVVALAAIGVGVAGTRGRSLVASPTIASAVTPLIAGASTATPVDASTDLAPTAAGAYTLSRGGARGEARRAPLEIAVGDVRIDATDASFVVRRGDDTANVDVTRGRVRVLWALGSADLDAGESGTFPPPASPPEASSAPALPSTVASAPSTAPTPSSDWRALARVGEFDDAFAALGPQASAQVRDDAGDLLLAADVARMSHHPAQAVDPLRRVLARHRADPRASLAAFTLGRVLLDELGRPHEAADAFADAQALAPAGPLAEDALAREVEAASRAGDVSRAHARAEQYVARYPSGVRVRSVRRYGGLD